MPKIQHIEILETLKKMSEPWDIKEVIEEFWGPYYQRFRGGVCEINQHAAS